MAPVYIITAPDTTTRECSALLVRIQLGLMEEMSIFMPMLRIIPSSSRIPLGKLLSYLAKGTAPIQGQNAMSTDHVSSLLEQMIDAFAGAWETIFGRSKSDVAFEGRTN
jgi:hypothetical protein